MKTINNNSRRLPNKFRLIGMPRHWAAVLVVTGILFCLACAPVGAVTVTRGPYLQDGTPSSIIVRWRTDTSTNSVVSYGTAVNNLTSTVTDDNSTKEHLVQLSGLQANTRYYYAIGSSGGMLAGTGDASYSFVTSPASGTTMPVRIWAIGDSGSTTAYTANVYNAYLANTQAENKRTNVWLMLGDNAYDSGTDAEYQGAVFNMFPQLLRQVPVWPTQGNDEDSSNGTTQTGPYYDNFSLPKAGEAGGVPSGSEAYYSLDYGNIHFISLDSFDVDRSPGSPMLTWLANDLAATHKQWIIAFWHHPPYSKGSHDSDQDWETWQVEMRTNVLPLLESYGVDLVLSGHSHSYERSYLLNGHYGYSDTLNGSMILNAGDGREDGNGAYSKPDITGIPHEGAVYVVAGSSSFTNSDYPLDHRAMYIGLATVGSLILEIDGGRLNARFLDRYGVVQDHFTITKPDNVAPVILRAKTCNAAAVTLEFAERVNEASAEALTNYAIGNGISITGAVLNGDARTVILNVSTLQPSFPYVMTVNNVMDLTGNAIAANTQVPFTYWPCVTLNLQDGVAPTTAYLGTRDTYLDESSGNTTTNFGSSTVLKASGSPTDLSTLLQWDLSSIPPGAIILSASLTLNITDISTSNYYLYEVLRDWQENEATWNNATTGSAWNLPGAAGSDRGKSILLGIQGKSSGKMTFPLNARGLAVIQNWVNGVRQNYGFVLARGASSNELDFSSSENSTPTNRPKFTLVYADTTVVGGNTPPTASYINSCTNLSCTFTDTSIDSDGSIASRLWNFGDGTSSTAQNPSHTFAAAGSYTVSLTVIDNSGASGSTSKTVTVSAANVPPAASYSYSCTYLGCAFTDASTDSDGSIASRLWNFGDGTTSTAQNPSYTFAAGGSYTVSLTVTDNSGASGSTSKTVMVTANVPPTASYSYSCTYLGCTFTDTSTDSDGNIASRLWNFGDGSTSTATNPSHTFAAAGSYTVSLTVTDNGGASGSTGKTVTVTANVPPTAAYSYSCTNLSLSCAFADASTDSDGSIASRLWNFGDGSTSIEQNPSHNFTASGTYTVKLAVTDNGGASANTSQSVTVTDPAAPPLAPSNLTATVQTIGKGTTRTLIVSLAWTDNSSNEAGFALERCTQITKGKIKICDYAPLTTVGAGVTSYVDQVPGGNYKYRVRAVNGSIYSTYSNEVSI